MGAELDSRAIEAARVLAMINGTEPIELTDDMFEDDIIAEENGKKPKKKSKAKSKAKAKVEEEVKRPCIEMQEQFNCLLNDMDINVDFFKHNIRYKEQDWPIPERVVEYHAELITVPKLSKDASIYFSGNNAEENEKAYNGDTRYLRVVTYDTVLAKLSVIGYVKIAYMSGKLISKVKLNKELLNSSNANCESITSKLYSVVNKNIE